MNASSDHANRRRRALLLIALGWVSGCAADRQLDSEPHAPPQPAAPEVRPPATPSPPAASAAESTAPLEKAAPKPPTIAIGSVERVLEQPVTSLALGKPRVAALGSDPWLWKDGWRKIPLPAKLKPAPGARDDVRIFFGRDDKPRLMGTRTQADGSQQLVYLRWRPQGWRKERAELARLAGKPRAGLFGVLGHADPEVVCKIGEGCIIKRLTGWATLPAPDHARVDLHSGVAWAISRSSISQLVDDKRWQALDGPAAWKAPGGLWNLGQETWVSEPATGMLHHRHKSAWASTPSPVTGPGRFWGSARDDIWVVGSNGAAHFDGESWSRVAGLDQELSEVYGRGTDVWLAGASGVWRLAR